MLGNVWKGSPDITKTATDDCEAGTPSAPVVELADGARVGRFVVEHRLGAGGMGVVYSAWDTELERDVALKLVRPRTHVEAMQARLRREAKAMARLSHRNVVPVFDIGTHDGRLFIAMELVAGETLRAWAARPRTWRQITQLFVHAARGLAAAHEAGLLHRDFKPENVMVGRDHEPRITDFGLARELDSEAGSSLASLIGPDRSWQITAAGGAVGTPAYMAPELLLGQQGSPASDQFSFCVSLFELLYGCRPFAVETPGPDSLLEVMRAGRVVKPAQTHSAPRWLHAAIVRGLAFDPQQRWPSMTDLTRVLERGLRRSRLRFHGLIAGVSIAAVAATAAILGVHSQAGPAAVRCLDLEPTGNDAVAILVCQEEYARGNAPEVGLRLAEALRRTGKLAEAGTVAKELLATSVRGDALSILGKVAAAEDHREDAERWLRLASELHRDDKRWAAAAADLLALAGISSDAVEQLDTLDRAVTSAQRGEDRRIEASSRVAMAQVLSQIGARASALREITRAEPLVSAWADRARVELDRGNVYQNLGEHPRAVAAFAQARSHAEAAPSGRMALWAQLNLVYSLAESGRLAEAAAELKAAEALDPRNNLIEQRLSLEARIAARGGDPARATGLIERAIAATNVDDAEQLLELEVQRAELWLQQGDFTAAERSATRAIERIEALRSPRPPAELRSWLVTDRRIPYEILFASRAGRGDAAGALIVLDRYRGADVLAAMVRSEVSEVTLAAGGAFPAAELARLLPLQTGALTRTPGDAAIIEAMRRKSLLALVVARGALWRITNPQGRLEVARLGGLAELRPRLERFHAAPADPAAAAVGDLLVPAELARPTSQVLHVLLDRSEPLITALPLSGLRVAGALLIAARPIVHATRASDIGCVTAPSAPPGRRRAVVISAGHDDATRAAVLGAARHALLYVAVPAESDEIGPSLVLRDGRLRALEIAGHGSAPAQVVIAARGGATGASDLAMAFIAAGAEQVVATTRPVAPATIARITERLQHSDTTDLARALARIQSTNSASDAPADWLGFAAFGRASCDD